MPNTAKKRAKSHKDVEFMVSVEHGSMQDVYAKNFDEAAGLAVSRAASTGTKQRIDVLISSVSGARWYGGDYAAERYREDPDASVAERLVVKVDYQGRIA